MPRPPKPRMGGDYESLHRHCRALEARVDQLSTLREIGLAVNGSLDLSETLPVIANVVQGALEVRRLTIYELDAEEECLRPVVAKYGGDLITRERLEEDTERLRGSRFAEALRTGAVVLDSGEGRNDALVPLVAKNQPLGVMLLQDRRDGDPFSPSETGFFRDLGLQVALAINNARLYAMAVTDGLTGLYVRRYFDLRMAEEFDQARRYGRPFSLLMFDIDHFKKFNDTHGHQTGDLVLRQFARLLQRNTRRADICCRYGGEEMAVILTETAADVALALAEKLCAVIRQHAFEGAKGETLAVTSSVGVAEYRAAAASQDAIVEAADRALYRAKAAGRDRVVLEAQSRQG